MPTNLNALIRYKQIDKELRNPYLKTTIKGLQKACSEQLAEHRGVYKLISERTIRDDIRVMRSEALGFNAPIIVENGIYSYSDTTFSIFNTPIEQKSLLDEILKLLIDEKPNIKNTKVDDVIYALKVLLASKTPIANESTNKLIESSPSPIDISTPSKQLLNLDLTDSDESEVQQSQYKKAKGFQFNKVPSLTSKKMILKNKIVSIENLTWENIMELI